MSLQECQVVVALAMRAGGRVLTGTATVLARIIQKIGAADQTEERTSTPARAVISSCHSLVYFPFQFLFLQYHKSNPHTIPVSMVQNFSKDLLAPMHATLGRIRLAHGDPR